MITLQNISKNFGNQKVIQDFSLEIADGDFIAVTGPSGSGKTTLLNIMGLLEAPSDGRITVDKKSQYTSRQKLLFYRHAAGFLFQNYALIEEQTVENNLKIALSYRNESSNAIPLALDTVGLSGMEQKKIYQLSGGEQQRVALARIILKDPKYIFADEPTGNLDKENRNMVLSTLLNLNNKGKTVIFVTHDSELAEKAHRHISL
jgi:putative ABC transport system ATP-binding protein